MQFKYNKLINPRTMRYFIMTIVYITETLEEDVLVLLKKLYDKNIKCFIKCQDIVQMEALSRKIWNARKFLPHATDIDEYATDTDRQPIFISINEQNANHAQVYMSINQITTQSTHVFLETSAQDLINQTAQQLQVYKKQKGTWILKDHNDY